MIKPKTFDWVFDDKLKLKNKSIKPTIQDAVAVWLMNYRDGLGLVKSGKIQLAFTKLREEWTSLPGASQQGLGFDKAMIKFREGIVMELNDNSQIATPKGDLKIDYDETQSKKTNHKK